MLYFCWSNFDTWAAVVCIHQKNYEMVPIIVLQSCFFLR